MHITNGNTTTASAYFPLPGRATYYQTGSANGSGYVWHKDWLGTVRLSSSLGSRAYFFDRAFAPFAQMYDNFGNTANLNFTGDTQDSFTGLFDTPNRELSSAQGRWISPDSAGLAAVDVTNPQTWNRYAYVANNPLSKVDPLGLFILNSCYYDPDCGLGGGDGGNSFGPGNDPCSLLGIGCVGQGPRAPIVPPRGPGGGGGGEPRPPKLKRGQPQCAAQLKTRNVNDPVANFFGATHSFWYVQDSLGNQYVVSGGPSNDFLDVWTNSNINGGVDNASVGTSWNSGLSAGNCNGVDNLLLSADTWPQNTITYNPLGPNSNTVANDLGIAGDFYPPVPPGAFGWNALSLPF